MTIPGISDFIRGAELLWILWTALAVISIVWTIKLVGRIRVRNPARVWKEEDGLSYTLAFVFTIPLYLLICCVFCEVTLLMLAKFGTVYGAYAGARSAVVWEAMSPSLREDRVREATVTAITPFTIQARNPGSSPSIPGISAQAHAADYVKALSRFSGSAVREQHLRQHFADVAGKTRVSVNFTEKRRGAPVEVTVTYRAAFLVPGVARLMDPDHQFPYEYPITSSTAMHLEWPVSENGRLGIDYRSY